MSLLLNQDWNVTATAVLHIVIGRIDFDSNQILIRINYSNFNIQRCIYFLEFQTKEIKFIPRNSQLAQSQSSQLFI